MVVCACVVCVPEICHGAVRCFELLDHRAVSSFAYEIGGDESGRSMHLGHLTLCMSSYDDGRRG